MAEFESPERLLSWDDYASPPSFSTASLEEVLKVIDDEIYDGGDESQDCEIEGVIRKSTRVQKPYRYREIEDFIQLEEDDMNDEVWEGAGNNDEREIESVTRKSKRVRKPYPYRGIEDYIQLDVDGTDDEVGEDAGNDDENFPQGFRQKEH